MTVKELFETGLVKEDTVIWIRELHWRNGQYVGMTLFDVGYMNQDCIQEYRERDVECFIWRHNNECCIDLKEKKGVTY